MKTPPFLMAAALLLWGWHTGFLIWAALMAVVLEGSRWIPARWELDLGDLNRIWDLCALLFVGALVLLYTSEESIYFGFTFARWQPFLFLPLMLAQAYGNQERVTLRTLSWFLRRRPNHPWAERGLNFTYPYFAICLMAANASNQQVPLFYPAIAVLIATALLATRPKRVMTPVCLVLLLTAGVGGHFAHQGLRQLQGKLESDLGHWLLGLFRRDMSFKESRTAIGGIGRIKMSGRIVMRVFPVDGSPAPMLLRDASYDSYKPGVWWASHFEFGSVGFDTNDTVMLFPPRQPAFGARISGYLRRGQGLLSLPNGTFEMNDLPAFMETNSFGIARVTNGPAFFNFIARYGPGESIDGPPGPADLEIPEGERRTVEMLARELGLADKTADQAMAILANFFQRNFSYSLFTGFANRDPQRQRSSLEMFLTESRSGHCEYFATATVLLLRAANVPARYATGYAVQEPSVGGKGFVVRERHGHAWVLVYHPMKKAWIDFDTTPSSWHAMEQERASAWERFSDALSWIRFQFSEWRWSKTSYTRYLIWLLIPLVLFLVWRIVFRRKRRRVASDGDATETHAWPGMDSEFYAVERLLAERGLGREQAETWPHWLRRIEPALNGEAAALQRAASLHQRHRFDPLGLKDSEREQLRRESRDCLHALQSAPLHTRS